MAGGIIADQNDRKARRYSGLRRRLKEGADT